MLLFNNFNHVHVIKTYGMMLMWGLFILRLYNFCSYKIITNNKRYNVRANMCQLKREFFKQITISLKT